MRVQILTLRYSRSLGGFDDRPLQEFVRERRVLAFREHFFLADEVPHLTCVVTWQPAQVALEDGGPGVPKTRSKRREEPDPLAQLDEAGRQLFQSLREWRRDKARDEGIPPYVVFTNRQLVEIIRARPENATALGHLEGIGAGKIERYAAELLPLVARVEVSP